jgi:hypothetical protein
VIGYARAADEPDLPVYHQQLAMRAIVVPRQIEPAERHVPADLAARMELDFQADLAKSKRVSYREWRRRPIFERIHEWLGWILERQE